MNDNDRKAWIVIVSSLLVVGGVLIFAYFEIDEIDYDCFEEIAKDFCRTEMEGELYNSGDIGFFCLVRRDVTDHLVFTQEEKERCIAKKGWF